METVAPIPAVDFNFDSACSSPYITAPSSPQRFGNFFFSAPTSPTRVSSLHPPPQWDHQNKPDDDGGGGDGEDFEFNFSGPLERAYLSAADELFDGGKIRPLKPQQHLFSVVSSQDDVQFRSQQRGRETTTSGSSSSYVHKKSRSLSPLRVTDIMFEPDEVEEEENSSNSQKNNPKASSSLASSILSSFSFSKASKKWKFTDLLLFRSASEGRATTGKDPLRKYSLLSSKKDCSDDVKNASFRSIDSTGSVSSSRRRRRRRGRASAHELHYTANRAVSEEMKRKTFLPYKQGLLGCLGFNPGMHEISKGFGSLTRG